MVAARADRSLIVVGDIRDLEVRGDHDVVESVSGALGAVFGISDRWLTAGRSVGGPADGPNMRNPSRAMNASPRTIGAQPMLVSWSM